MAKWELAIAVKDEEDLSSGHKRKKEGDIIAFKPHPWKWGSKEVKNHLIVIVDGLDREQVIELCSTHNFNKRRFNLPLDILKDGWNSDIDLYLTRDINIEYQPFVQDKIIINTKEKVSIFFDKEKNSFKYKKKRKG